MTARITFRAKPDRVLNMDGTLAWEQVKVPKLERRHCTMDAFRRHPRYGSYANSDLFPAMLARIAKERAPHGYLRLDRLPEGVEVDRSAFLAVVTFSV